MVIKDRYKLLFPVMLVTVMLFAGCATPQPTKINTSELPVQSGTIPTTVGSIWPGENSRNSYFQDLRARHIGDIVTVLVSEKTSAVKEATTSTSRKTARDISIGTNLGLPSNMGINDLFGTNYKLNPNVTSDYDSNFDGTGKTERSGELTAIISTRIVEILPNGNLVIEGKKDTILNKELQYLVLSGIIRPVDISDRNTIPSSLMSDARIEYSGKGVLADTQKPGWLGRILDNVWPY
jgi:flagellar L-ring protein precursor FlgH